MTVTRPCSLKAVGKLRDKLLADPDLNMFVGAKLSGDELAKLCERLQQLLPKGVTLQSLLDSCMYLTGCDVTSDVLFELCWRLAGNSSALRSGYAVPPWSYQAGVEWMPLQIVSVEERVADNARRYFSLRLRVLAGSACPRILHKSLSPRFCAYIARSLGFTAPFGATPYESALEFTGMRLYGLFTPTLSTGGAPGFDKLRVTGTFLKHNKQLIVSRRRASTPCPCGVATDCLACVRGTDSCVLAVRPHTVAVVQCSVCGKKCLVSDGQRHVCTGCKAAGGNSVFFK